MSNLKTKWDLTPLLTGDNDPQIDQIIVAAKKAYDDFATKWEQRHDYLADPGVLRVALDDYENLARNFDGTGEAGYYFWLRYSQDQTDPKIKSQNNKLYQTDIKLANQIEFFTNRLAKIPAETQEVMLNSPTLLSYKHFLESLFKSAQYLLSEPEERVLNLKNPTSFGNWVRMVKEFISKEEREVLGEDGQLVVKPFDEALDLVDSQVKDVRDRAAAAVNDIFAKHVDAAEHELNSILMDKKINDELRGMARPDLARHLSDDIDTEVVDQLISAVSSRYDLANRYYALKAKLLGVDKLAYHERNVILGQLNRKYPYDKAVDLIRETFDHLDPDFAAIFMELVENGRIDVYPKKGRYGGAFCTHKRLKDPNYILLTHNDKLGDVLILAHETGHAINNVLIARAQNALNNDTPLSTAEVASTFMEDFVFARAQLEYSPQDRLFLIMEKLNDDISTVFRQIACYQFEQDLHRSYRAKNYLTKEEIGELFLKHMHAYMGDAVELSPGAQNWWIYWSHIRSFFYVYSYASGLLISKSLQNTVRQDKTTLEKVKKFLAAGLSASPKELFLGMDINICDAAFWQQGLNEIADLLKQAETLAEQQLRSS